LDLKVAGEELDHPTELAQANQRAAREISDVRDAVERQEVMHAQRVKRDRTSNDELVVALVGERGGAEWPWREQLGVGVCDSAGRLLEAFILDVRAERAKQFTGRILDPVVVDLAVGGAAGHRGCGLVPRDQEVWRGH
jgi:hypothetical protein